MVLDSGDGDTSTNGTKGQCEEDEKPYFDSQRAVVSGREEHLAGVRAEVVQ